MTQLHDAAAFYAYLRTNDMLGPSLAPSEVNGCDAILSAVGADNWPIAHAAYGLGTAYHETAHTMQPIKEFGGPSYFTRMYDVAGQRSALAIKNGNTCAGDGALYFGRGYVQCTWKCNYARASEACGVDLIKHPDKALDAEVAAKIMVDGMGKGWFTGKANATYLPNTGPATPAQFRDARRIINGTDRAVLVAGYATQFQSALQVGRWA